MAKYSKSTIEALIKKLDQKVKEKIEIITIGGTALSLTGDKELSKDIDLCYGPCSSPSEFAQNTMDSGREIGIAPEDIEIFQGMEMTFLEIPDFSQRAIPYDSLNLNNIILKTMHPEDIILSKIYRYYPKDRRDIKNLLDNKKVTLYKLQSRFISVARAQKDFSVRREFQEKYILFIKDYKSHKLSLK